MRTLKKVLCQVLILSMLLSLFAVSISAADLDYPDAAEISEEHVEAVQVISAINVMRGYSEAEGGNFNPKKVLTRAEAAAIICRMMGVGLDSETIPGTSTFTDMEGASWAQGYVGYLESKGIINGVGDGKFDPSGDLTNSAFAKMLLGVLGYDATREEMTGPQWAINVAKLVTQTGLSPAFGYNEPINREDAAQLAYNSLTQDMVWYNGTINESTGEISSALQSTKVTNTAYDYQTRINNDGEYVGVIDGIMQLCESNFPALKLYTSTDKFGNVTKVWYLSAGNKDYTYKEDASICAMKSASPSQFGTEAVDVANEDLLDVSTAAAEYPTYKALYALSRDSSSFNVYINNDDTCGTLAIYKSASANVDLTTSSVKPFDNLNGAFVSVIDNDGNGKMDSISIQLPYLAKVTKVTEGTEDAPRVIDLEIYDGASTKTTAVYPTDKFLKGDLIYVYPAVTSFVMKDYKISSVSFKSDPDNAGKVVITAAAQIRDTQKVTQTVNLVSANQGVATAITFGENGTSYPIGGSIIAKYTNGLADDLSKINTAKLSYNEQQYTAFLANGYVIGIAGEAAATNEVYIASIKYTAGSQNELGNVGAGTYTITYIDSTGTTQSYTSTLAPIYTMADGTTTGNADMTAASGDVYYVSGEYLPLGWANAYKASASQYGFDYVAEDSKNDGTTGYVKLPVSGDANAFSSTTPGFIKVGDNTVATANAKTLFLIKSLASDGKTKVINAYTGISSLPTYYNASTTSTNYSVWYTTTGANNNIASKVFIDATGLKARTSALEVVYVSSSTYTDKTGNNSYIFPIIRDGKADTITSTLDSAGSIGLMSITTSDGKVTKFEKAAGASYNHHDHVYTVDISDTSLIIVTTNGERTESSYIIASNAVAYLVAADGKSFEQVEIGELINTYYDDTKNQGTATIDIVYTSGTNTVATIYLHL